MLHRFSKKHSFSTSLIFIAAHFLFHIILFGWFVIQRKTRKQPTLLTSITMALTIYKLYEYITCTVHTVHRYKYSYTEILCIVRPFYISKLKFTRNHVPNKHLLYAFRFNLTKFHKNN